MSNSEKVNRIALLILKYILIVFAGAFFFSSVVDIYLESLVAAIVVLFFLILNIFNTNKKSKYLVHFIVIGLMIISLIFLFDPICGSFLQMLNLVIDLINSCLDIGIYHASIKAAGYFLTNFIAIFILFYFYFNLILLLLKKSALAYFFYSLFLLVILCCFGIYGNVFSVSFLITVSFVLLVTDGYKEIKIRPFLVADAICLVFILIFTIPTLSFSSSNGIDDFKYNTNKIIDNLVYNGGNEVNGDLTNAKIMRQSNNDMMTITTNQGIQSLYLKGYVGGNLENNHWQEITNSTYAEDKNAGLMEYLNDYKLPYTSGYQYDRLNNSTYSYDIKINLLSSSKKRYYYPYYISDIIESSSNYDYEMRKSLFSSNTYSFTVSKQDVSSEATIQASWVGSEANDNQTVFLNAMANYQSFAYDNYLDIAAEDKAKIKDVVNLADDKISIFSLAITLRNYFTANYKYNTGSNLSDFDSDFIDAFYNKDIINANSVYFATAATYAFRAYGFPARYVEGYLYSNTATANDGYYTLTGDNQHAWVEVYFDGIGWLPIELTPGFYVQATGGGGGSGTIVTPPDPSKPKDPSDPNNPQDPSDHDGPDNPNKPSEADNEQLAIFKGLAFSAIFVLIFVIIIMVLYYLREYSIYKRKKLINNSQGEKICRYFYSYYNKLLKYNKGAIDNKDSIKFNSIIEKGVFSKKNLDYNEYSFLTRYIDLMILSIKKNNSIFVIIYLKYIKHLI